MPGKGSMLSPVLATASATKKSSLVNSRGDANKGNASTTRTASAAAAGGRRNDKKNSIEDFFESGSAEIGAPGRGAHGTRPPQGLEEMTCPFQAILRGIAASDVQNGKDPAYDRGSPTSGRGMRNPMPDMAINERFPVSEQDLKLGLHSFEPEEVSSYPLKSPVESTRRARQASEALLANRSPTAALMCPVSGLRVPLETYKEAKDNHLEEDIVRSESGCTIKTSNTASTGGAFDNSGMLLHAHSVDSSARSKQNSSGAPSLVQDFPRYGQSVGHGQSVSRNSKLSGGSRRSGKSEEARQRRVRKGGTFSAYEASNYDPLIRKSWELTKIRAEASGSSFAKVLFKNFLDQNEDLAESIFAATSDDVWARFLKVFEDVVHNVEDPVAIQSTLRQLAPMHIKKGVKAEHTGKLASSVQRTLMQVLGSDYSTDVKAAWEWLWTWLSQAQAQALDDAMNEATVLTYSWDLAMDNYTEEEMGMLLYDTLFELAPNLRAVYRKPRQILSSKFVEMMATLVSFHGDSMRMEEQITWLGFRHIKYGAKAEHVKVIGDVLVETLARAVEQDWTMDMANAWHELWNKAAGLMMKVIDEANLYGFVVQNMWNLVQERTTEIKFGSTLRKLLLSGTEWVSSLSYGILESASPAGKDALKSPLKTPLKSTMDLKAPISPPPSRSTTVDGATPLKSFERGSTFKSIFHHDELLEDKSSESDAIGRYFWVMLTELFELLWEPEQQNERLIVMTTRLFHWGIRSKHLPTIGEAIGDACKRVLKADWSKDMRLGWNWWWSVTSKQMAKTLYVCEQDHVRIITESWFLCKERSTTLQLGELFFKELARMSPHIMHLFKRPKIIQAAQFVAVVDSLVSFIVDPALFFEGFKALTIRHIKYSVKSEYAKVFGKAILIGIEKTLGEDFDMETREVWQMLWMRASSCVSRALNVGTNPVIVSLVQGDVEKMSDAVSCAERGVRFQWLTNVDINGESISPIYWSMRDGNTTMVRYIINDLLTIRADREMYYYGQEVLFAEHPGIVSELCTVCPEVMLDTLFTGLMWHSKDVENGSLRVNYYIRELYGDPKKEANVWKQCLAVMVTEGRPYMFQHPLAQKLLDVKWTRFGKLYFMLIQAIYILIILLFMTGSVEHYKECEYTPLRYFVGVVSFLFAAAQGYVCYRHWKMGWMAKSSVLLGLPVPSWIADTCNFCRITALLLIVAANFFDHCAVVSHDSSSIHASHDSSSIHANPQRFVGMALNAFAAVLLWSQTLQMLVLSTRLAALTYTLGMMAEDVSRNLVVVAFFIAAFATALTSLSDKHTSQDIFSSFGKSLLVLIRLVLGIDVPDLDGLDRLSLFFLFLFIISAVVGMLNILIAQLWSSFASVANNRSGYAIQHRANICMHMESILPMSMRIKLFEEMFFDTNVPFNQGDAGPSGGIQVIEPASVRNTPYYTPDRILRFTGDASPNDPWPEKLDDDAMHVGLAVSTTRSDTDMI